MKKAHDFDGFLSLMEQVQKRVLEKFQVRLEPEVRIVGRDA